MVMRFIMINNLKAAGVKVMVAPYEADHQIVRLFREKKIKSVYSKDCGFFFYGVPYIPKIDP
jgi:predicted Fe-Mo cluster-binding NifX family protein